MTVTLTLVTRPEYANPATFTHCLGNGAPKLSYGSGWTEVARPKRAGFADWEGGTLIRMAVPILCDGVRTDTDVQPQYDQLESLVWNPNDEQPPQIQLVGPVAHTEMLWVAEGLDPDDDTYKDDGGRLLRQSATLTLMEYQPPDIAVRKTGSAAARPRRYTTRKGDTLQKIASKRLGSSKRWTEIKKRNPSKLKKYKSASKLPAGITLTLPNR